VLLTSLGLIALSRSDFVPLLPARNDPLLKSAMDIMAVTAASLVAAMKDDFS
jgi:hypothetical protein